MMFREMRRNKQLLSAEETAAVLEKGTSGVLALAGDDGYPYAIPINFLYDGERNQIIFHGARAGHKVDSLKRSDKVCFTVFGNETIKDEPWAPYMQSTVVFGRCHLIDSPEENIRYVRQFAMKYYPDSALVEEEIGLSGRAVQMFVIDIEHMSGKEVQER